LGSEALPTELVLDGKSEHAPAAGVALVPQREAVTDADAGNGRSVEFCSIFPVRV